MIHYQVVILVDDMIDSGTTLCLAARELHEKGAKSIHAVITHGASNHPQPCSHTNGIPDLGLLSEANLSIVQDLPIDRLVVCSCLSHVIKYTLTLVIRLRIPFHKARMKIIAKSS